MALDKQRILSELGSVMNQLQSADCGCMGKLFSNPGQDSQAMGGSMSTSCRQGHCCGHGFGGTPGAGEPYSMNSGCMNRPCMGRCNPPKLYADTYNYLNQNLMQPVVQECYHDLSTISPANSIGNNPLAQQMGLQQGNPGAAPMEGNMGAMAGQAQMPGGGMGNQNEMQNMGGMPSGNAMSMNNPNANPMGGMSGMGAQIMNMMMSGGGGKPKGTMQGGQMNDTMLIDAPHSPHGQVGVTPLMANQGYGGGNMGISQMGRNDPNANQGQLNAGNMGAQHMQTPVTQYVTQDNMYTGANAMAQGQPMTSDPTTGNQMAGKQMAVNQMAGNQMAGNQMAGNQMTGNQMTGNPMAGNMVQSPGSQQPGFMNSNPASQQMANANRPYGQHTAGVTKFNEMFPGVMQGGDLGFDPMALAIQMNPANQKRSAMDTMQKMMNGSSGYGAGANTGMMQTGGAAPNAIQPNQPQQNYAPNRQGTIPANQMVNQQIVPSQQNVVPGGQMGNQQMIQGQQQVAKPNAGALYPYQQQVYTAQPGAPGINQQQMLQQQVPQQQSQQQMIDPNTGAPLSSANAGYEGTAEDFNAQMQQSNPPTETAPVQDMIKEPIFPADRSIHHPALPYTKKFYQYNTLGQPVHLLPGNTYHTPIPNLPQTLSPQPSLTRGKYGVKSTVSKTSLAGNKPVGRTPSRGQLQNLYQQYKGSQSYTQQNVRAPGQPTTNSDGKLNITSTKTNPQQQIPVEAVGGDTIANKQMINNQVTNKVDHVMGQIGDVPVANKPQGDVPAEKVSPTKQGRLRNGLQDMIYTSYPASASWSFHGDYDTPISAAYRARNRV